MSNTNKLRLFVENFLIYGIGSVISKIIPFVVLPILSRIYPSAEYMGLNDLVITISYLGSAIAILGINNAMFRLFFEDKETDVLLYKKKVCSSSLGFVCFSSTIVVIIAVLLRKEILGFFFGDSQYSSLVTIAIICIFNDSIKNIISTPTRMENKRKVFLIINTICPLLSYSLALVLIKKGMYVYGLPIAMLVSAVLENLVFAVINRKWFSFRCIDKDTIKQLCMIALPLAPNFIIYWVFNSCDKVMIRNLMSIYDEGIYSVAAKYGHASQLIYTAFAGGWQYFAFSTMNEGNQVDSNSKVFEYLAAITMAGTLLICSFIKPAIQILFPSEYSIVAFIIPYLFAAPLSMMLYQVVSNQFLVIKKTWPSTVILTCAAVINIVLNALLISLIGIEGAAIATLVGYLIANIISCVVLSRSKLFSYCHKTGLLFLAFSCCFVTWRLVIEKSSIIALAVIFAFEVLVLFTYRRDLLNILSSIRSKREGR